MGYLPFLGPRATPVGEQAATSAPVVIVLTIVVIALGWIPPMPLIALILGAAIGWLGSIGGDLFIVLGKGAAYIRRQF